MANLVTTLSKAGVEGENLKSYILQICASLFAVISGLIALYVVSLSTTETISDVENPII